jgi:hypothetical protein
VLKLQWRVSLAMAEESPVDAKITCPCCKTELLVAFLPLVVAVDMNAASEAPKDEPVEEVVEEWDVEDAQEADEMVQATLMAIATRIDARRAAVDRARVATETVDRLVIGARGHGATSTGPLAVRHRSKFSSGIGAKAVAKDLLSRKRQETHSRLESLNKAKVE